MAYAVASKATEGNLMGVQIPSPAPFCFALSSGKILVWATQKLGEAECSCEAHAIYNVAKSVAEQNLLVGL